jgi:hypothetical protein
MSSTYGWIIDIDYFPDEDHKAPSNMNAKGMMGPRNLHPTIEAELKEGEGKLFRMYDDDGEAMYDGRYIGPDDETAFAPLDDFGTPNAGCTRIDYRSPPTGEWETL